MTDGRLWVQFSWEGKDGGDDASGRGGAVLLDDGTSRGQIYVHMGDDSSFLSEPFDAGNQPSLSQLCPNNWVPARPAESRSVSGTRARGSLTGTERDSTGLIGTEWETVDPPRNAQVDGSSPTSGSSSS